MKKTLGFIAAAAFLAAAFTGCTNDSENNSAALLMASQNNGNSSGKENTVKVQGAVYSSGINIGMATLAKTSEVVIVPAGTTATIAMEDDSSWNTYCDSAAFDYYKGVFLKNRKVKLSPFVMGQYEVTQELYNAVMETNPSSFTSNAADGETQKLRPVETVTHYQTAAFCNELTKKTMTAADVVYYSDETFETAYTKDDAAANKTPYMNKAKKGYRLPTEAEWEYAARGGNPKADAWKFAYAGKQSSDKIYRDDATESKPGYSYSNDEGTDNYLYKDANLEEVAWYWKGTDTAGKTHEVGKKAANALNLYDMSGNVWEWCWDWYGSVTSDGSVEQDPTGAASGSGRVLRGGGWINYGCDAAVSYRTATLRTAPAAILASALFALLSNTLKRKKKCGAWSVRKPRHHSTFEENNFFNECCKNPV